MISEQDKNTIFEKIASDLDKLSDYTPEAVITFAKTLITLFPKQLLLAPFKDNAEHYPLHYLSEHHPAIFRKIMGIVKAKAHHVFLNLRDTKNGCGETLYDCYRFVCLTQSNYQITIKNLNLSLAEATEEDFEIASFLELENAEDLLSKILSQGSLIRAQLFFERMRELTCKTTEGMREGEDVLCWLIKKKTPQFYLEAIKKIIVKIKELDKSKKEDEIKAKQYQRYFSSRVPLMLTLKGRDVDALLEAKAFLE